MVVAMEKDKKNKHRRYSLPPSIARWGKLLWKHFVYFSRILSCISAEDADVVSGNRWLPWFQFVLARWIIEDIRCKHPCSYQQIPHGAAFTGGGGDLMVSRWSAVGTQPLILNVTIFLVGKLEIRGGAQYDQRCMHGFSWLIFNNKKLYFIHPSH